MKIKSSTHSSSPFAGGLAMLYFLTNAVGVYSTEGTLWNDRRKALAQHRSDPPVFAQAPLPFSGGSETSLIPSLQFPPPMAGVASVLSSLPPKAQKSLAWLPSLAAPYGEIRDISLAGPEAPLVLHIQDAHDVEEAQRNMRGLVQSFLKEGHVRLVGLEGASGPMPLDPFRQLPNKDITRGVLDLALRLGYIGGAELAAFDAPQSTLWGIESSNLYAGNLRAFEKGESFKRQDQGWMDHVSLAADAAGQRWYGPALKEFESHRSAYTNGNEGLDVWLSFLWSNRPPEGKYPQLSRLKGVLVKESKLDFKVVERERQSLAEVLARALPPSELQRLVDQSLNQRLGRLSFGDYHRFLESLGARHSVKMSAYPHLKEYISYVADAEGVDRSGVIDELADLEETVERQLAVGTEEKKVAAARRDFRDLRKLINHQFTPSEWHAYDVRRPDPVLVAKTLAELAGRDLVLSGLQGLKSYEDYSSFALKRNRALADNLLAKMRQEKTKTAVLVAGGFHTEGLTQALKESGASYVVLGPRITKVPKNSQALEAIVRDPLPLEKLLAGDVIHLATPRLTGSLEGVSEEASMAQQWAERGKQTIGSLQFAYQSVHAPGVESRSFDGLRREGYLPESITQEVIQLPLKGTGVTAVVVRGVGAQGASSFAVVESKGPTVSEDAGVMAKPISVEKMTVDGQPVAFSTYRPDDVKRPGVLVQWARDGVLLMLEGRQSLGNALRWGGRVLLRGLRGFGVAWENFSSSRLGRTMFPTLERQFVVPFTTGEGLGSSVSDHQSRPKKLADIFPYEPTHWSSVQREDLTFVLTQLGEGPDSVLSLTKESTDEGLLFALTAPVSWGAQPPVFTLRFTLASDPFPNGQLYSVNTARGPPEVTVSLHPDIFRADRSSLKRHLSAVVQKALSTLPGAPFGQGDSTDYQAAQRAVRESQTRSPTWLEEHAPRLKNVSLFSRSMESIFNRTLAEQLQTKFGFDMLRFLSQTNFTGGLGHVTNDYLSALGRAGGKVAAIYPSGTGLKASSNIRKGADGGRTPPLPLRSDGTPYESMGDMLRDTMSKREDLPLTSYRLPENAAFWDWVRRGTGSNNWAYSSQCFKALALQGKEIFFDVYVVKDKFSGAPIFYLDAYSKDGERKIRVFDELYGDPPDAPWRAVQVLVYSQANQLLISELVRQGYAHPTIVTLDHEVFAQFPDLYLSWQGVKGLIRHAVHAFNHTVYRPGMWNLRKQAAGLLGLDARSDLDEGEAVSIAGGAVEVSGATTGVSHIHALVLLKNLFAMVQHKVVERFNPNRPDRGSNSANGVLLEHWQGVDIRRLIDSTKEKLGLPASAEDETFYEALEQTKNQKTLQEFQKRFEMVKAFYSLDLLIFLNNTQTQPQGGGHWLTETLGEVEGIHRNAYTLQNIQEFRDRWQFLINRSFSVESTWEEMDQSFGDLKEALLKRPIVSNVRRQVSYKGPDMYLEIFKYDLEAFKNSNVRLIFGGRTFGGEARAAFDEAKRRAQSVGSVAFLENYNSEDAPIIFRGATAGVMLSDERLEAAATSNSKIVVNGGWLISVHDGASPERMAVLDKRTNTVRLAITYTHDDLRAGLNSGVLELLNGSLIPFDDNSQSYEGKGAGRRPSRAGLLDCFSKLGQIYGSPDLRRRTLYQAIRWSYTADIHRQTHAFLEIENDMVLVQDDVESVVDEIISASSGDALSLSDSLEALLYKKGPNGFTWLHKHNLKNPVALNGIGASPGWAGFLEGFRSVKGRYYFQGPGSQVGDEEGQGRWSLEHHVLGNNGKNEMMSYTAYLLKDLPAFQPLLDRLSEFESWGGGTNSPAMEVRMGETLKALEFVQRTVDRVCETVLNRDLKSGAEVIRRVSLSISPAERETVTQQNYSYGWKIAVSPTDHSHDYSYLDSGATLRDLRDALRQLLNENSRGPESIKQASYGMRGGYFFTMMGERWSPVPALRNFAFSLADQVEDIKTKGGEMGWNDPAIQWEIRRVYAEFLGALDEWIDPSPTSETQEKTPPILSPIEEIVAQEAPKAGIYQNLGPLNRDLLGGAAHSLEFGSLTANVTHVRSFVEAEREHARSAQSSLSRSLGGWDLTNATGRLSESAVMKAGQSLSRAVRQQAGPLEAAPVVASRQVFMALASLGEYLEDASVDEWHRWASVLARGFNENLFEVQERVLASIESGRRLDIEISETMLNGNLTEEDKTRLEELGVFAAHAERMGQGKITWILPEGKNNLDPLWSQYPQLMPLKNVFTQHLSKAYVRGVDGKCSVKKLLMTSQGTRQVESLNPSDLYLINRSEWVLESDLPNNVARILISLAGGLIYDATEKVGDEMKSLFFLRTNA
ncbi:MAG: hypothetical protein IPN90_07900 [Elusimicrobia bacterium]|nr:hypothetical protein [Elusimicrobiota bacterium]